MPQEKTYRVKITRGCMVHGEGLHPDGKGGPIVEVSLYDARAIVSAGRGEFVDKVAASGPMTAAGAGRATIKGK